MLFRSTAYQRDETELLMVVTAHLVRPLRPDEMPFMPGEDEYNDPRDVELFLMGTARPKKTEAAKEKEKKRSQQKEGGVSAARSPRNTESKETTQRAKMAKASDEDGKKETLIAKQTVNEWPYKGPVGPVGFIRE
jgi:Flp pilus assembly secretin CpaC